MSKSAVFCFIHNIIYYILMILCDLKIIRINLSFKENCLSSLKNLFSNHKDKTIQSQMPDFDIMDSNTFEKLLFLGYRHKLI